MLPGLNLADADEVCRVLRQGAAACAAAKCRDGSVERISGPGRLIATGDLHDNPLHLARLLSIASMIDENGRIHPDSQTAVSHLVLHEIIHSDRLVNGMDFSYRALVRVAAVKAAFPEHAHVLLANHEMAQLTGNNVIKDGVRCLDVFDAALDYAFNDQAPLVRNAINTFIRALPLGLLATCSGKASGKTILVSHSLPAPAMMSRFDPTILSRPLDDDDYEARRGSAYMMVWGRGYDAEQLEDLVERWGVNMFIVGHEKAEFGAHLVKPNAVVLNSDHDRGVYLPIDLDQPPTPEEVLSHAVPLGG